MRTNRLAAALALSDQDLRTRIDALAGTERETTAELVAHLAALERRSSLYAAQGYGSLFAYYTEALHLSEDAACNRIEAVRACQDFPVVLDLLASGSLTLTAVRMLRKHLTKENHEAVLARAKHQRKAQIEALLAELAPKPDVVASVRKLPVDKPRAGSPPETSSEVTAPALEMGPLAETPSGAGDRGEERGPLLTPPPTLHPVPRALVQALAPERYRVQFTIGQESHDKLRRLQTLLRREVPNGDAGLIFERFIDVLLDKVEREKLGKLGKANRARTRRRSAEGPAAGADENRIRSGTDRTHWRDNPRPDRSLVMGVGTTMSTATSFERRKAPSRHIPNAVKRAVWFRDRGQCAFVAPTGHRCMELSFLELHHIHPYALEGPPTVGNVALRCRRHNQYEAELIFQCFRSTQHPGPRGMEREGPG